MLVIGLSVKENRFHIADFGIEQIILRYLLGKVLKKIKRKDATG